MGGSCVPNWEQSPVHILKGPSSKEASQAMSGGLDFCNIKSHGRFQVDLWSSFLKKKKEEKKEEEELGKWR